MCKRMVELLSRVEAESKACNNCFSNSSGYCQAHKSDMPPDFVGPCEKWELYEDDIPF